MPSFLKKAGRFFDDDERAELAFYIASNEKASLSKAERDARGAKRRNIRHGPANRGSGDLFYEAGQNVVFELFAEGALVEFADAGFGD
jgi:hypothetical protein